jgi:hypothetical protein
MVVQQGVLRWLGAAAGPARSVCAPAAATMRGAPRPRPAWSIATPIWSTAASARMNLPCAWPGASYEEVAQAGGGIVSSRERATRAASEDELFAQAVPRLQALLAEGVCAIEIKSGYGLALEHERKQLRVARRLGEVFGVTVRTTFLGAHALPPEYAGRSQDYIDLWSATRCCPRWPPKAWSMRWMCSASASPSRWPRPSRCSRRRSGWASRQAARRAALGHGRRAARGPLRRAVVRPHRTFVAGRHRRHAMPQAPWPCCCPAPTTRCATRKCRPSSSCALRACPWRCRPTTTPAPRPPSACCSWPTWPAPCSA